MTMGFGDAETVMPRDQLLELLNQLRWGKMRGSELLRSWAAQTADEGLRAGLARQAQDEARHVETLSERIRGLGQEPDDGYHDEHYQQAFEEVEAAEGDFLKLAGYHRAIRQYVVERCSQLTAFGDPETQDLMEEMREEEERAQRWGESRRVAMMKSPEQEQAFYLMLGRIQTLTARSRERIARQIRERAEAMRGGQ